MATEAVATRRRIIRRPRLTTMLDESPARIKLLVAPAGYGKTTLAQEWLGEPERLDVWYRGSPATADVAALAAGMAIAVSELIPDAGKRMRERLRVTGHPEEDVDILAELFAEDIQEWPDNAWLAVDDYQFAMESVASERFVELITQQAPLQLLITSRRRPTWATARRTLYGEVQEIERRDLAMETQEAGRLLRRTDIGGLLERAEGWPAVLGLAALSDQSQIPEVGAEVGVPRTLYRYFAEEILQATDRATQLDLAQLALAQVVDETLAHALLGERASHTLREGTRLGVFNRSARDDAYSVHPLLREFLELHLLSGADTATRSFPKRVGECLVERQRWDEAFDLADRFDDITLAERVLESALDELLREGRVATVARWLERLPAGSSGSAVFDVAEAEIAFRLADHAKAEVLAAQAAARLRDRHPLESRAYAIAGRSALIASREHEGLEYFELARTAAQTASDTREALVGLYFAASELGLEQSADFLTELSTLEDESPDAALRIGVANLTKATREGGIGDAVARQRGVRYLALKTADPLAATSFLHMLGNALNLLGHYEEASEVITEMLEIARRYRMSMPEPHALLNRALAQHGLREFKAAHASLDGIFEFVPPTGDAYLEFYAAAIRARIFISEGRLDDALDEVQRSANEIPSPTVRAEYLATQAFVSACAGDKTRTIELLEQARKAYRRSVEARVLGACASAIIETDEGPHFGAKVKGVWATAFETGNFDGIVCGYRGYAPLLVSLFTDDEVRSSLADIVSHASDEPLARRVGLQIQPSRARSRAVLTPRESEVLSLLHRGLSNRAIAGELVLSEATVKVHLRHIYKKLGVKNRVETLARELKP